MKGIGEYDLGYATIMVIETENEIMFCCNTIKLDATFNKLTGKITGTGSRSCKELIKKIISENFKEVVKVM